MTPVPTSSERSMPTVLVIEDDPDILASVLTALETEGFEGIGAENGCIAQASPSPSALTFILCDVSMPGARRLRVPRALRALRP
ncbi:MAG: hypothetical protein R3A52_19815 [Polyangiales bacterium]